MLRAGYRVLFMIVFWSMPSAACELFGDEARYRIEHEMFGPIGEETLTFHCENDLVVIDRTVDVDVRLLMASVYHRHARYTEVWRNDRLVRFQGTTDDNGTLKTLVADVALDNAIAIRGPKALIKAPLTVIPTDPWHLKLVHRTLLFDRLDGQVSDVRVVDLGTDQLNIDGHWIDARKFAIFGSRDQELWFDRSSGFWLKSMIRHGSGDITITRQSPRLPSHLAKVKVDGQGD